MIRRLACGYRSWTVINARYTREKSKAIKRRYALLTNYPPWIVIASLCQSLWLAPVSPAGFAFRYLFHENALLFWTDISRSRLNSVIVYLAICYLSIGVSGIDSSSLSLLFALLDKRLIGKFTSWWQWNFSPMDFTVYVPFLKTASQFSKLSDCFGIASNPYVHISVANKYLGLINNNNIVTILMFTDTFF